MWPLAIPGSVIQSGVSQACTESQVLDADIVSTTIDLGSKCLMLDIWELGAG